MTRSARDLALFARCFEKNDAPRALDELRWQYLENPVGRLFVDLAVDTTHSPRRLAAIYATRPAHMQLFGERVVGVQSMDTLTDGDFRGQGLFGTLAASVFARCGEEGVALVYGFPNASSAPGFFGRLGWRSLDPLPMMVRPMRPAYFLERLMPAARRQGVPAALLERLEAWGGPRLGALPGPWRRIGQGLTMRAIETFDASWTALWEAFSAGVGVAVVRDAAYMRWRTARPLRPGEGYRAMGVYGKNEELLAGVVWVVQAKHGGQIGYVLELLHRPEAQSAARALLACCLAQMAEQGADAALAWNFGHSPNHRAFWENGFLPLPERLRPIELHVGVRPLAASSAQAQKLADRRHWYLSYCDSDTV